MLGSSKRNEGSMKRTMMVVAVMAATAIVFSVNASAGDQRRRVYEGTLGADGPAVGMTLILRDDRAPALLELEFGADMTCDDGTSQQWSVGMFWGGALPPLPSHMLDLDSVDIGSALHLHGKVQAVYGEGTFSFAIAALTVDETPQLCSTGELPWTVTRTVPPVEGSSAPPAPLQVVRFVTDGAQVTMTRTA